MTMGRDRVTGVAHEDAPLIELIAVLNRDALKGAGPLAWNRLC